MQALQLSVRQGWNWLIAGFALFRKNPAQLTMIIIGYWLLIVFLNSLPLLGPVLATLSIPAFSVGLMNTCRELERGKPVLFPELFAGFRIPQTKTLLVLGALYLGVSLFALAVSALADGGLFMQTMLGNYQPTEEDMARGELVAGAQLALLVMAPAIMAWWFAPVLVAWHGVSAGKALFFSFVACVRNWKPFLAYTACVTLFGALLPGLLVGVLAAVFPALAPLLTSLILVPLLLILAPALVASFYVSYREVFVSSERPLRAVIDEPPGDD